MKWKHAICGVCVVSLAAMPLLGCAAAGEHRTRTGGLTGALVGGGAGAAIDKDNPFRGALIGSIAGAAIGAGIGHVLQRQKEAFERIEDVEVRQETVVLQQPMATVSPDVQQPAQPPVQEQREALLLRVPSEILFARDSSVVTSLGVAKVQEIAQVLRDYPESDVYIRGFTSSEGDVNYNYRLSQERADNVRNALVNHGINPNRLFTQGMGPSSPIAPNDTEAGRAMNRRVELHVVPRSTG